jgi:uncharacterized membrane protein (UPF0127 family)
MFGALTLFAFTACASEEPRPETLGNVLGQATAPYSEALAIITEDGRQYDFFIELADEDLERQQGLMHRETLPENGGMLFDFFVEAERAFWMKNTIVPLDILYIKPDGTIHHIHPDAVPFDETPIPSNGRVSAVLEIHAGLSALYGIEAGDMVHHTIFFNALESELENELEIPQ